MAHVIAFANQKGGVAKTTSTVNLGAALREHDLRVLAVDMDPQGNLTMSQGIDTEGLEKSMYDVLVHRTPIEDVIYERELDVAASTIDLAGAEMALATMIGRERALQRALDAVRDKYDYILIDTPPSLGLLTINALTASEGVIVPVQCEYLSLRGLLQLEKTLEMIRENLNPDVQIQGILPTLFDARTHPRQGVHRDPARELRRPRLRHRGTQDHQVRRGARERHLGAQVRSQGQGGRIVPRSRAGGAEWQIVLA